MASERTGNDRLRILIADDQELVRNGFKLILSSYGHLEVVGEARNGLEAIEKAQSLVPDVVLMDIRMPVKNGIEATEEICRDQRLAQCRVLILTTFDIDEYVYGALAAGASGFLLKDAEPDDIITAIEVIAQGDALIQPSITRRLIETFVHAHRRQADTQDLLKSLKERLTDRELEILGLVARGLSNDEIAQTFVISPATVKTHLARIMAKLDVHDRAQLVVLAYENGLTQPGLS
ncbi:MAG: response regulator transcription factor [Coriobacteriaceae bacterium]|jgi:DNA-binding NarL/FixJ family response regulator|nr:response regulator transcription factor [Coriobacteriaceae bacterium]